jgi:alanine racemase
MTHFRSADELSSELFWQQKQWEAIKTKICQKCQELGIKQPLFHSANSATVLRMDSYQDDFARCGIAIYGYDEMHPSLGEYDLKPVLKLYAQKISSRALEKGDRVGYGGVGVLKKDSIVTTYDIGYGDGFFRHDGKSDLILGGKEVLGRVSMDSIAFEGEDEKICLIGDAKAIAKKFGTISYDVLVKLSPAIDRRVV